MGAVGRTGCAYTRTETKLWGDRRGQGQSPEGGTPTSALQGARKARPGGNQVPKDWWLPGFSGIHPRAAAPHRREWAREPHLNAQAFPYWVHQKELLWLLLIQPVLMNGCPSTPPTDFTSLVELTQFILDLARTEKGFIYLEQKHM